MAIHQAGHAVVQTLVGGQSFTVARVSLDGPHGAPWQGNGARGEAALDREVFLSLYEFGLVTLAGIAAEERYLTRMPPEVEPVVAISDLAEWQEAAEQVLGTPARIDLVSRNIIRTLDDLLANDAIWRVVEHLANLLVVDGTVHGAELQRVLAPLAAIGGNTSKEGTP